MTIFPAFAFVRLLVRRLIEHPFPDRYDVKIRRERAFMRYLRNKRKKSNSHPILPGLQVNTECFLHLFNMQHVPLPRNMATCGTYCLLPRKIKELRAKFQKLYNSGEEFGMFMTCLKGIFIRMHFSPNMSGKEQQMRYQVFTGERCLFNTIVDVTLENETTNFQILLRIDGIKKKVCFFYNNNLFFPIPFSKSMYSIEHSEIQVVSFYKAFHGYKPNLSDQNSFKRLRL
jgi:hypothetical protein